MNRNALVIGINNYPFLKKTNGQTNNLTTPATDAEAIASLLENHGNFKVKRLPEASIDGKLQVDPNGTVNAKELQKEIKNLFLPESQQIPDTALLFFTGHGLRKKQAKRYKGFLATSDCNFSQDRYGFSLQVLREILENSDILQQIIWLDCCYAGELLNFEEANPEEKGRARDRFFVSASADFEEAYQLLNKKSGALSSVLLRGLNPRQKKQQQWINNFFVADFICEEFQTNPQLKNLPQRPVCHNYGGIIQLIQGEKIDEEIKIDTLISSSQKTQQKLTVELMYKHFERVKAIAGTRYTPEINVDLPEARIFEALGTTDVFFNKINNLYSQLYHKWKKIKILPQSLQQFIYIINLRNNLENDIKPLINILKKIPERDTLIIDFDSMVSYSKKISEYDIFDLIYPDNINQIKKSKDNNNDDLNRALNYIYNDVSKLKTLVTEIYQLVINEVAACHNRKLLLIGEAGTGKTHLLCDIAKHRLDKSLPTIILLGQHFTQGNPWTQIINRFNLSFQNQDEFLEALETSAKSCGSRAMILIDALNETTDKGLWKNELAGMLTDLDNYPNICIAVSCRTSYEKATIPEELVPEKLVKVKHHGFENHEYIATKTFFNHYGIELPNVPLLVPEFSNPLFLKTLCQGLNKKKLTRIPKGCKGITAILNLFIDSVHNTLSERLNYDEKDNLVKKALQALALTMADNGETWIERKKARTIVNSFLPISNSNFSQSLFSNLIAEGLLSEDLHYSSSEDIYEDEQEIHIIRFPYEKFSDHLIVRYLLQKYFDKNNPEKSLEKNNSLGKLIQNKWNIFNKAGLFEALCVQIPELIGKELMELTSWNVLYFERPFLQSIIWRNPKTITQKTKDYLNEIFKEEGTEEKVYELLLTVATEPNHPLNAKYLHKHLLNMNMSDRDAIWSVYLYYQYGEKTIVDRLVEWAWDAEKAHICDESIELYAIALTWFLTTSDRFLRDRATKALVSMLHPRPLVLVKVIEQFLEVNDLYVLERLYAVAYGVAMLSENYQEVGDLAHKVYEWVFKDEKPPTHILLRDYASGVIEVANNLGALSTNIDMEKTSPPYQSDWELDIPTQEELELYIKLIKLCFDNSITKLILLSLLQSWDLNCLMIYWLNFWLIITLRTTDSEYHQHPKYALDLVQRSVLNDDPVMGGDFSIYVIDYCTNNWFSRRINQPKELTKKEKYEQFIDSLTDKQKQAWKKYTIARENVNYYETLDREGRIECFGEEYSDEKLVEALEFKKSLFLKTIGKKKTDIFLSYVLDYLENSREENIDIFDSSFAKRWILKRVFELGWTIEQFGFFD